MTRGHSPSCSMTRSSLRPLFGLQGGEGLADSLRLDMPVKLCRIADMASRSQVYFVTIYTTMLVGALCAFWLRPTSAEWPAWVQAIGSIMAIAVAVWISNKEGERARADRIMERQEFRRAVAALARRLADLVKVTAHDMEQHPAYYEHEGLNYGEFYLLDQALDRFDPSRLVSADGVVALESLRKCAKSASFYEDVVISVYLHERYEDDLSGMLRQWAGRANGYAMELEKLAE